MNYVVSGHKISDNSRYLCLNMIPMAPNSVFNTLIKASLKIIAVLVLTSLLSGCFVFKKKCDCPSFGKSRTSKTAVS